MTNGFFGTIHGPFRANEEILTKIQEQCVYPINYLSKIGFVYTGNLVFGDFNTKIFIIINNDNNNPIQIGKTRILELEDVQVTSLKFQQDVNDRFYIDYQYVRE